MKIGLLDILCFGFFSAVPAALLWGLTANWRFWRSLPTLDEYLEEHPECNTGKGISCCTCGSRSIRNWGIAGADDWRRSFVCNHCGNYLHRGA